jgi:hypothetical protein
MEIWTAPLFAWLRWKILRSGAQSPVSPSGKLTWVNPPRESGHWLPYLMRWVHEPKR